MSIVLNSKKGRSIQIEKILWCFILYLGQEYNWKPIGTQKPEEMLNEDMWDGNYDSSDGQNVASDDANNLGNALLSAINDKQLLVISNKLMDEIKNSIELSVGRKLDYDYSLINDDIIDRIKNIIDFLMDGEFFID